MMYKIPNTAQKMKFFIKDLLSKCCQIRKKLRIWSHLLKKSLMENFIFCAVKKQRVASSLELSLEKSFDRDVFKDSLKSKDYILILKR